MNKRITESELILPALYLMSTRPQECITTSELIPLLTQMLQPKGLDAELLDNRNDTYFSQKVRNLKSHDTLTKQGLATYKDSTFYITDSGKELVEKNRGNIQYILSSEFNYEDVRTSFGTFYDNQNIVISPYDELVSEGKVKMGMTKTYQRSSRLRNVAIDHFTTNGTIKCDCCGFEFKDFYGDIYGTSCIEIHHLKPIFQYENKTEEQTIESALKNLLPVCPNCHRVIHKNHIAANQISEFKQQIETLRQQVDAI